MALLDAHVYLGEGAHLSLSEEALLALMDEADIAVAVASPVDRFLAVDNREGNDLVLKAMRRHPDRIAGWATVNPWYGRRASDELERALGEGLHGLTLEPLYQGFRLTDPIVFPLLEIAERYRVPVYAPSGTPGLAEPFHVLELARRFPTVQFVMGHAGASDYYCDAAAAAAQARNIWLETSRNGPGNYCLFASVGLLDRVVFGSSAPEYVPAVEAEILRDVISDLETLERIFESTLRQVFGGRLPC